MDLFAAAVFVLALVVLFVLGVVGLVSLAGGKSLGAKVLAVLAALGMLCLGLASWVNSCLHHMNTQVH